MKTDLFDFHLPEALIADRPASPRDSARLLVIPPPLAGEGRQGEGFLDSTIRDLPSFLRPGDVMVFNDTKVIPARLMGMRGAAKVEILLHKQKREGEWLCFAKPAKRLKVADRIVFGEGFDALVTAKRDDGQVVLQFTALDFHDKLLQYGTMPLPPYIEKKRHADSVDNENYQTVYAKHEGSVAAPTAGLHFTDAIFAAIDAMGVIRAHVTLHVGGGTFLPVKAEDTGEHIMHSEYAVISQEASDTINAAKKAGGRVIAVGTTSLRTLESAASEDGLLKPFAQETSIFITPGYRFKAVDALMTNFHLPKSTLFMLVSAFSGLERMQAAYKHAIAQNYRFYSYGDACLLLPKP